MTTLAQALGLDETKSSDTEKAATDSLAAALREFEAIEVEANISTKDLLKAMLETKAYRKAIFVRLITGSLPPAVECKIYDHAIGKPVDVVHFEDKTDVSNLTVEELQQRHEATVDAMQKILAAQHARH